jgi:hypothetical protein
MKLQKSGKFNRKELIERKAIKENFVIFAFFAVKQS